MDKKVESTATQQKEIVITRTFNTSRELVWKALTYPEWVKRWWGPKNFTAPVVQIDLRVGGKYLYCMRSPEGRDYWSTGIYREIVPAKKLVVTDNFADENGKVVPPEYYGLSPDFPQDALVNITLEDENGKTRLTMRQPGPPSEKDRKNAETGWNESFDKLAELLEKSKTEIQSQFEVGERPPGGFTYHSA